MSDDPVGFAERASTQHETESELLARKGDRAVFTIRVLIFLILVSAALAVSLSVYFLSSGAEQTNFDEAFHDKASKVIDSFASKAGSRIQALTAFSVDVISYARYSNSSWPAVTMPDFEERGRFTIELASLISLVLCPIVTKEEREMWEAHATENEGWLADGLAVQEKSKDPSWVKPENWTQIVGDMNPKIYNLNGTDIGQGPYTPTWETVPAIQWPEGMKYNLISDSKYTVALTAALETGEIVISRTFVPFNLSLPEEERKASVLNKYIERWEDGGNKYLFDPVSNLVYPIFDVKNGTRQIVALFKCFIYWRTYFIDILPDGDGPLLCVLKNTCGDVYSYEISGREVDFLGEGDLHDKKFDSMVQKANFSSFQGISFPQYAHTEGLCLYSIHVYPTTEMKESYVSSTPVVFVVALALIFVFTSFVFILYDYLVQRRQRYLANKAIQSGTIVSALFPATIRDRMYHATDVQIKQQQQNNKNRLMAFAPKDFDNENMENDILTSEPIADLFPECTVFFADIVGFTSWSADRQPTDVFKLLESIYGAFDRVARKHGVFKVETIGDCYVAVTGLPKPQANHAEIMASFASECQVKMSDVKARLAPILGFETGELSIRVGLHSGPVTAGVLRGERSRFQLFGDTVNTAARMEQSGKPNMIQLSSVTADALAKAGRCHWFRKRDENVVIKGKGEMQTFWLKEMISMNDMKSTRTSLDGPWSFSRSTCEFSLSTEEEEVFGNPGKRSPTRRLSAASNTGSVKVASHPESPGKSAEEELTRLERRLSQRLGLPPAAPFDS